MLKIFILMLSVSFSSSLFATLKAYNEEKNEWNGNVNTFYQYLEEDGQLTEKALTYALPHLSMFRGFEVDVRLLGKAEHGAQTQQLFSLIVSDFENGEKQYIIKVYKELESFESIETLKRLLSVKNSALKSFDLDDLELSLDMPRIAFDVWSGSYEDKTGKTYCLSIFKKAPGSPFKKIIDSNESESKKENLKDIYYRLGRVIASMHFKFSSYGEDGKDLGGVKTKAYHGDLQAPNIFYCTEKNIFTLIDYEFFALGLKNAVPIKYDFAKLLPFEYFKLEESIPFAVSLIKGYASVWPDSIGIQEMLVSFVLKKIKKRGSSFEKYFLDLMLE